MCRTPDRRTIHASSAIAAIVALTASLLVAVSPAGCGDDGGTNGNQNNNQPCPQGHEPHGRACVPVFDECPGPAEIAVLGGGCQPVGVTQCATGFVSDGEGGCDPVLPADPCPNGTMEVIGETECQPVGVTTCATGFVSDNAGGCDPVLPTDTCSATTMEVLGESTCQPIGDCGTGTWGTIATDATTIFVDANYGGGSSDGSDGSPFTTIGEALAVVQPSGQIAIAAGDYAERLIIDKPVNLDGRCAEMLILRGVFDQGEHRPPVLITSSGSGTTLRGVSLTGDGEGLVVDAATSVTFRDGAVENTGDVGIRATDGASLDLYRVVVRRATGRGIYSEGSTAVITECVIRDTQSDTAGDYGRGIQAVCDPSTITCGSLTASRSVVYGNREAGIIIFGVDSIVTSTVIRGTLGRQRDGLYGRGVHAECDPLVDLCGSLMITGCVVVDNHDAGIRAAGVNAVLSGSVVRDTGPDSDGLFGHGIESTCSPYVAECGSLTVENSVIEGNRELGIAAYSVRTAVNSTIVRNTQPDGDGLLGRGIYAECDPAQGACGRLSVTSSLVERNHDTGILTVGVDATVAGSVVRDTRPRQADDESGRGVVAGCSAMAGACPALRLEGSVISGNREIGILVAGADAEVTSSVVQNTLARQSDGLAGQGIHAQCDVGLQSCGSLAVTGSLIRQNRDMGIAVAGVDADMASTVVRDTQERLGDGKFGRGIEAQCDPDLVVCPTLSVTDSLIDSNRDESIFISGGDAVITGTVVRNTLAQQSDHQYGRGINAQCDPDLQNCGSLTITDTLVTGSYNNGMAIVGVDTVLAGVSVRDTWPNEQGDWMDDYGQGIFAFCFPGTDWCGSLQMTSCTVSTSHTAALAVQGVPGFVQSSLIDSVFPRPLDNGFGYGIQIERLQGLENLVFDIRSCRIRSCTLAGILYSGAGGTLTGSAVYGGLYAVVANVGSSPDIADDNDLTGTTQDGLAWGNMDPSPAPAPALPANFSAE